MSSTFANDLMFASPHIEKQDMYAPIVSIIDVVGLKRIIIMRRKFNKRLSTRSYISVVKRMHKRCMPTILTYLYYDKACVVDNADGLSPYISALSHISVVCPKLTRSGLYANVIGT
jgi:hypothetical protein